MPRYIAFLRAINVGGHVVKMDLLRGLFERLRFSNVETFIASGNVIFSAPATDAGALETTIEAHLAKALGYEVATFVRRPDDVRAIARHRAYPAAQEEADGSSLHVAFLKAAPSPAARRKLAGLCNPVDELRARDREVFWLIRGGFSDSALSGGLIEKTLGMPATVRNVNTVRRLAAKYGGAAEDEP